MGQNIYTEARIEKSMVDGKWEADENGNPIIIIEASNDNLDFDEEKVLQSALMASKDYFLQNGVISYDHKHIPSPENLKDDPSWNEEKNILGHPVDAWLENGVVKVKAVLYPSVDRASEIIKKLQVGAKTVRASVGGRRPMKKTVFDPERMKDINTITSVLWDDCALTYKPVNQTLGPTVMSPKEFVKSLMAGSSVNPVNMTGGNALQVQSLEKKPVKATKEGLQKYLRNTEVRKIFKLWDSGDILDSEMKDHIKDAGFSGDQAEKILNLVKKNPKGGNAMEKSKEDQLDLDDALESLAKSLGAEEDSVQKAKKKMSKAEEEELDLEEDEDEDEDEGKMKKSQSDFDEDFELVDVSEDITAMRKGMNVLRKEYAELRKSISTLTEVVENMSSLQKSIAETSLATGKLLKSIGSQPVPRKAGNLNISERFEKSVTDKIEAMPKSEIIERIQKSNDPDLPFRVQKALRRGEALPLEAVEYLAKSVRKEG